MCRPTASVCVFTCFLLLVTAAGTTAELIDEHIKVETFISAGTGFLLQNEMVGNGTVDTDDQALINGPYSGSGRARVEQDGAIMRSRSAAISGFSGTESIVTTIMRTGRRDVLEVIGSGAPPTVRFTFSVHATLTAFDTSGGGLFPELSFAAVAIATSPGILNFPIASFPPLGTHATVESVGNDPLTTTSGGIWDTAVFTPIDDVAYEFYGTFSLLSSFVSGSELPDGGYFMNVGFETIAAERLTSASADGFNTMVLQSITLPDGSPLPSGPELSYQFESGAPVEPDTDGDSVADSDDNCLLVANPDQTDTNGDNFGNACDADISGAGGTEDCVINFIDLAAWVESFLSNPGSPNWNPDADFDANLTVNFVDFSIMASSFFAPPGPSGLSTACDE